MLPNRSTDLGLPSFSSDREMDEREKKRGRKDRRIESRREVCGRRNGGDTRKYSETQRKKYPVTNLSIKQHISFFYICFFYRVRKVERSGRRDASGRGGRQFGGCTSSFDVVVVWWNDVRSSS